MSLYVMYFGTNKMWDNLVHHNVMFCGRYKELLSDIFDRGVVADDFSLYCMHLLSAILNWPPKVVTRSMSWHRFRI